jgi:hypothetical protein
MKRYIFGLFVATTSFLNAQTLEDFVVEIEPLVITNAPGVQSYTYGKTSDGKWIILGGRIDGLHQRQPFAAFQEQDNNKQIFVIDPVAEQVWNADMSVLPAGIFEQLQSTNQNFHQVDTMLYVVGGYGDSPTAGGFITYPNLTAISVDEVANAVINGTSIIPYFRQITDTNLKITGGQMGYLDGTFYLVGGHLFDGAYNPMGPDHGPGFVQVYSNDIRTFDIDDDGVNLSISNYAAQHDTVNLHRRDYNMAPQIFPDGSIGFTAFSGVFDYNDMPYLNTVDVTSSGYTVNNNFNQYLSQYHSAKLPIFDNNANAMHTVFFGGLSQYTLDNQGNLVEDVDVPFVKTISKVTRLSDGSMQEVDLNYVEMPTLVGPGAEYIPVDMYYDTNDILDINSVPQTKTLVGYVYGGIESSAENIFFVNDGTQSAASNVIFKVYINKSIASTDEISITGANIFNTEIYPVPTRNKLNIEFFAPKVNPTIVRIVDASGRLVMEEELKPEESGDQKFKLNVSRLDSGTYTLILTDGVNESVKQFIKN